MPDISARDLRRLQSLDDKLRAAQKTRREQASEARALRGKVQAAQRAADTAQSRMEDLLAENQRLAGELESASTDLERAATAGEEARTRADQASADAQAATKRATEAESQVKRLEAQARKVNERLRTAEAQLQDKGVDAVVPASRVAELVDGFIGELQGGLTSMDVSQGELRLKVGMALVDDQPGFVVPTPSSSDATVSALQEVTIRFDRRLED